jgi:hypothetical protein
MRRTRLAHRPSPITSALVVGAGVALAGPGVLGAMWKFGDWDRSIPGFPDFRAGSLGDMVFLPLTAGALAGAVQALPRGEGDSLWLVTGAIGGAVAGGAIQAAWLADPAPQPQWSFVRPHRFSAAGAWHAVFFTTCSSALAGMWLLAARRLGRQREHGSAGLHRSLTGLPALLVALGLEGFMTLVLLDARDSAGTDATRATVLGAIAAAVMAAAPLFCTLRSDVRFAGKTVIMGTAASVALGWTCRSWPITWGQTVDLATE